MLANRQDEALAAYVASELYPFSPDARARIDAAGLPGGVVRSRADLVAVEPVELAAFRDPVHEERAVLRPTPEAIERSMFRLRWWWHGLLRRRGDFVRSTIDPVFRPVRWLDDDGVLVGSTAADLDRLGDLGRRWLEQAGVTVSDAVVALHGRTLDLAFWQLTLGCRAAGVGVVHAPDDGDPAWIASLAPTVLAGDVAALEKLIAAAAQGGPDDRLGDVRLVLATSTGRRAGPLDDERRVRLSTLLRGRATVVHAWAPPGVRALWAECHEARALHTWPDSEVLEVVDPTTGAPVGSEAERADEQGEVLWTPIGWRGTAVLRLRTRRRGRILTEPCPGCGRTTPRLDAQPPEPPFVSVLDRHAGVAAWQAEVRRVDGTEHVALYVVPASRRGVGALMAELDVATGADRVEAVPRAELRRRLGAAGGRRIVRLR
jgi:hypothetical protein